MRTNLKINHLPDQKNGINQIERAFRINFNFGCSIFGMENSSDHAQKANERAEKAKKRVAGRDAAKTITY